MTSDTKEPKKHYNRHQINGALSSVDNWIRAINVVAGVDLNGKREGEPCPVCGGNDRFCIDNKKNQGDSICRKCEGGNSNGHARTGIRLVSHILNISYDEACAKLGDHLGLTPEERTIPRDNKAKPQPKQEPPQREKIKDGTKKFRKKIIKEIRDTTTGQIEGTAAWAYFKQTRGLNMGYEIKGVRFGTIKRFIDKPGQKKKEEINQTAICAAFTDSEGKTEYISRTYLKNEIEKDHVQNTQKLSNRSPEEIRGAIKLFEPDAVMGFAEGLETSLAAHELSGFPVWACDDANHLAQVMPPAVCRTAFIFTDLDQDSKGYKKASQLYYRLVALGLEVYLLLPGTVIPEGKRSYDFLDFHNRVRGRKYTTSELKSMAVDPLPEISEEQKDDAYHDWKEPAPIEVYRVDQIRTNQTTGRQTPKATLDNLDRMLDFYKVAVNYNEISKKPEFLFPKAADFINQGEDLKANAAYGQIVDLMVINNMPTTNLDTYLQTLQQRNTYNPVREWIDSKPWDGHDYLWDLTKTIELDESRLQLEQGESSPLQYILYQMLPKWLSGSVGLLYGILEEWPFIFTLQSDKQGLGKTYWFRKLIPAAWRVDGVTLDLTNNDSLREALGNFMCELGEIDGTIKKNSMDEFKAFMSKTEDEIRTPYAKYANNYKRRTAFFGTCNPTEFLRDDQNRRIWVIPVKKVDSYHTVDMQQVFAQCLHNLRNGFDPTPSEKDTEVIDQVNKMFLPDHPIAGAIYTRYDFSSLKNRKLMPQQILQELGFSASERSKYSRICGRYFKVFGTPKITNGRTLYEVPYLKREYDNAEIRTRDVNTSNF